MLVEDDAAIVDIYQTMMKKDNFEVEVFSTGEEAIKAVKAMAAGEKDKPDIILLDLILPDINGTEVFREVKKDPATKDIKVFIMTNQQDSESQWPDEVKPDKFFIKANTTPTQLLEVIEKAI